MRTQPSNSPPQGFWARSYSMLLRKARWRWSLVRAREHRYKKTLDRLSSSNLLVFGLTARETMPEGARRDLDYLQASRGLIASGRQHCTRLAGLARRIAQTHDFPHGK